MYLPDNALHELMYALNNAIDIIREEHPIIPDPPSTNHEMAIAVACIKADILNACYIANDWSQYE